MVVTKVRVESTEVSDVSARVYRCGSDVMIDARYANAVMYQLDDIR